MGGLSGLVLVDLHPSTGMRKYYQRAGLGGSRES